MKCAFQSGIIFLSRNEVANMALYEIKNYIKELSKSNEKKRIATAEDVQAFWTDILNNPEEQTKNRLRASELLAKVQGLFNDW